MLAGMNEYQQYFAEEIASDCGQGHITRSEALRRLRVLGVSAAAALSLLAACGSDDGDEPERAVSTNAPGAAGPSASPPGNPAPAAATPAAATPGAPTPPAATPAGEGNPAPAAPPAASPTPSGNTPPAMMPAGASPQELAAVSGPGMGLPTEAITFEGPNGPLQAAFAAAAAPRGAVLVIHENRGLNDHIRTVVGRFAAAGFTALGLDLLSEEGGTSSLGDAAAAMSALSAAPPERFVADMRAALAELERRAPGTKIGAVGFCFGGGMMWRLIASGDERLAAAAPFSGPLPMGADFSNSSAAVLAFYGELDTRVNASREAAQAALEGAGLTNQIVTAPGANHAFFNDTGMNYNQAAAADAWTRVLAWFSEHLS
jgi:carboxymethylenebutenolidase